MCDEASSRFTQAMYDEVSSRSTQAWLHSQRVWQTSQSERMANKHRRVDHPPANSGSAYNLGNPDRIPRSHREFLEYKGSQVVQGFRNAKNLNLFHGKMCFAKNPPHEPADDGSFIVHWSRWDSVSNAFDWSTGLDYIVRELSDISIGQRLALQVKNAFEGKKVDAGIKQLEIALLTKKVVVAIAEERYPISSHDRIGEYSFLIIDVHSNPVELKAVHVMHELQLKAIPRACMTCINLFAMPT